MAYDKVVDSAALDAVFTDIAEAIRAKAGTTDTIAYTDMAAAINELSGGGSSGNVMVSVRGTIGGSCIYGYLDENKQVQTITGTSPKGDPYEISAYAGVVFVIQGNIYGRSGNGISLATGLAIMALSDGAETHYLQSSTDWTGW